MIQTHLKLEWEIVCQHYRLYGWNSQYLVLEDTSLELLKLQGYSLKHNLALWLITSHLLYHISLVWQRVTLWLLLPLWDQQLHMHQTLANTSLWINEMNYDGHCLSKSGRPIKYYIHLHSLNFFLYFTLFLLMDEWWWMNGIKSNIPLHPERQYPI